ncbi:MAG TPA: hypothetical protein VFG49_15875 [Dyella sp.]|uniref:hypothetical protein n=1 Tax=Dyella sp. TaxID=1869338 RepID=UPI002D76FEBB|nr:hypothetical protein [Dyella sp.]HET6555006.1 hypothetical protein [Dyella sp.]
MKKSLIAGAVAVTLLCAGAAIAVEPVRDVSSHRHPNIAAAQRFARQAFEKISAAQEANEFDLGGHAAKAKELLEQANQELRLAAETANKNH